jgi:hypothetical protein
MEEIARAVVIDDLLLWLVTLGIIFMAGWGLLAGLGKDSEAFEAFMEEDEPIKRYKAKVYDIPEGA